MAICPFSFLTSKVWAIGLGAFIIEIQVAIAADIILVVDQILKALHAEPFLIVQLLDGIFGGLVIRLQHGCGRTSFVTSEVKGNEQLIGVILVQLPLLQQIDPWLQTSQVCIVFRVRRLVEHCHICLALQDPHDSIIGFMDHGLGWRLGPSIVSVIFAVDVDVSGLDLHKHVALLGTTYYAVVVADVLLWMHEVIVLVKCQRCSYFWFILWLLAIIIFLTFVGLLYLVLGCRSQKIAFVAWLPWQTTLQVRLLLPWKLLFWHLLNYQV